MFQLLQGHSPETSGTIKKKKKHPLHLRKTYFSTGRAFSFIISRFNYCYLCSIKELKVKLINFKKLILKQ
jgi:hypothetical protein